MTILIRSWSGFLSSRQDLMTIYFARLDHLHSFQSQMCGLKGVGMGLGMTAVTGLSCSEGKMVEQDPEGNWVHWGEVYQGLEQITYGCCDQCY